MAPSPADDEIARGKSTPTWQVTPYRPDGRYTLVGLLWILGPSLVVGMVLPFAVSWFSWSWIGSLFVFSCVIGFMVGAAGHLGMVFGKVRAPVLGRVVGFLSGSLSVVTLWALDDRAVELGRFETNLCWPIAILFGGIISAFLTGLACSVPFCNLCEGWKTDQDVHRFETCHAQAVEDLLSGRIAHLIQTPFAPDGTLMLNCGVCPRCLEHATVEIRLESIARKGQDKSTRKLLVWVSYPGAALATLRDLLTRAHERSGNDDSQSESVRSQHN
jgi:hypothetical protein